MEEEAQRIAQGQVPEPVPESVLCKDSTPSSINAIFSPPVGQFEYTSPSIPTYNPFETPTPPSAAAAMDAEQAATLAAYEQFGGEEPMEASEAPTMHAAHHEEAATGAPPFDPCSAPTPTDEEVDAALAVLEELDNIPDGVCESGEVEEEEEEEEEWSYYHMQPQTHPQGEDVLVGGAAGAGGDTDLVKEVDTSPVDHTHQDLLSQPCQSELLGQQQVHTTQLNEESFREEFFAKEEKDISGEAKLLEFEYQPLKEDMDPFHHDVNVPMEADQPPVMDHLPNIIQASMENVPEPETNSGKMLNLEPSGDGMPDFLDNLAEPSSPVLPGSPRPVEGYVSSVELNTPEESMGTNFNINQTQDLNGSGIDQSSGPFSIYVNSSPEPQSMEPPFLPPVDLNSVSEFSNGHAEEDGNRARSADFSPVEIVHAQSTVEVLAPPSPDEKQEAEMEFVIPEHVPDLMTTSQIIMEEPSDITFILEPAIKPVAEVPVPVYLEGTTPVSDGEREEQSSESLSIKEDAAEPEKDLVSLDTKMAISPPPPAALQPEMVKEDQQETRAPFHEEMEIVPPVNNGMINWQETPAPVQEETIPSIVNEVIDWQEVQAPVQEESVPLVNSEVVKNEVVDVILTPEVSPVVPEKKTEVPKAKPEVAKSPTKAARTPAKSSPDKAGKTTPAQDTTRKIPASKTTARTPLTKSAEKRTPLSKTDAKPSPTKTIADRAGAARSTTAKPTSTTRLSTTKPTTTKPAAPKPAAARPAPRTTKAPTPTQPSTKPTEKKAPKPATPTVPRAALSKPSSATTKSTTTRQASATRTTPTTKRPGTAPPARPIDKADSSKLNGTARPSTRPATALRTTGASTTTTTARKPLSTTRPATKSTGEKETKNTTNRILSTTTKPAPRSTMGAARTTATKTSTLGRTTEAKTTSRLNGTAATTTTTTKSRITTKSTATKATDVATKKAVGSRLKAAPGTKTSPAKAAPVIEAGPTVVNGENKIAHEETSVEVVEKCVAEDTVQVTEKILTEAMTTQQVITTETTGVIVNGAH